MRTPHLASSILAASALPSGKYYHEEDYKYIIQPKLDPGIWSRPRVYGRVKERLGLNQRQQRKNDRRANAAGVKNAFNR